MLWLDGEEEEFELVFTQISTVDMVPPSEWYPWPSGGTYPDYTGDKLSIPFTELNQPLPASEQIVTVSLISQIPIIEDKNQCLSVSSVVNSTSQEN